MNRQAQIHLSETIAVLFIFFVLVFFGLVFYYKYEQVAFQEKQEEYLVARAMDTTLKALFLPELICSRSEHEPEANCVDRTKFTSAQTVMSQNQDYYFDLFGYANISLTQVYPEIPGSSPISLYHKEKTQKDDAGNEVPIWKNKESTVFSVALKNEIEGKYNFGYLKVEVYS